MHMSLMCHYFVIFSFSFQGRAILLLSWLKRRRVSIYVLDSSASMETLWSAFWRLSNGYLGTPRVWKARQWVPHVFNLLYPVIRFLLRKAGTVLFIYLRCIRITPEKSRYRHHKRKQGQEHLPQLIHGCIRIEKLSFKASNVFVTTSLPTRSNTTR